MKTKGKDRKNRLLRRFLISYIIILIIPMFIAGLVFKETASMVKEDSLRENLNLLEQTMYIIDQGLKEMDTLSMNITADSSLRWLLYKKSPIQPSDVPTLRENLEGLQLLYNLSTNFIMKYYLIYPNSNTVLTPSSTYNLRDFYGNLYINGEMRYEDWKKEILGRSHNKEVIPSQSVFVEGSRRAVITYLSSMPFEQYMGPLGTVMILINEDEMLKPLRGINTEGGGNVFVLDSSGRVVASKHKAGETGIPEDILKGNTRGYSERSINGKRMLFSYTTSQANGWTFVAVSQAEVVLAKANHIRNLVWGASVLCLLLGLVTAYFMSYKNAKPIREIIRMVMARTEAVSSEVADEYNYLHSTFSKLMDNDTALRDKLKMHIPFAQAQFISRIIKGELSSMEEINSNMLQVELNLKGAWFNVLLVHIKGYQGQLPLETLKELNALKLILKNILGDVCSDGVEAYASDMDEATVAFLMVYPQESEEASRAALQEALELVGSRFSQEYNVTLFFGFGNFYSSLLDLYYSYSEAKNAMDAAKAANYGELSLQEELNGENWLYYYPVDLELRLINLVKAGNRQEAGKLLEMIYRENFEKTNMSVDMISNLLNEMRGTALKISKQVCDSDRAHIYHISSLLKKLKQRDTSKEAYGMVGDIFMYMCDIVEERKRNRNSKLREGIFKFIEENYMKQELSLSYAAARFDFSDTNFSYFFKEQAGENFSDYVEKLRIERACILMANTNLCIKEIAEKVGYCSSGSFSRAFKRCKGVIPSEYKKVEGFL